MLLLPSLHGEIAMYMWEHFLQCTSLTVLYTSQRAIAESFNRSFTVSRLRIGSDPTVSVSVVFRDMNE